MLLAISVLNILKTLTQVVNAAQVRFFQNENQGSFAAMLLLESVLEPLDTLRFACFLHPFSWISVDLKLNP